MIIKSEFIEGDHSISIRLHWNWKWVKGVQGKKEEINYGEEEGRSFIKEEFYGENLFKNTYVKCRFHKILTLDKDLSNWDSPYY